MKINKLIKISSIIREVKISNCKKTYQMKKRWTLRKAN